MHSQENERYWEGWNSDYSKVWRSRGRQEMSKRELSFIKDAISKRNPQRILDIGVGNGRILDSIIGYSEGQTEIYGLDISQQMVEICKEKFKNEIKIRQISVCDLSEESIPFDGLFDFATSIRVLKYNEKWREMIKKVYVALNPKGVYIFTIPNRLSISGLSGDTFSEKNLPIIYSSHAELRKVLRQVGFSRVDFQAFSKMPNFLYHICENVWYVRSLLFIEKSLEVLLGKSFLGRELFVKCVK